AGRLIVIAGDVVTTVVTGKPKRTVTVRVGAAWLSGDGGSTWVPTAGTVAGPALVPPGPGAQPRVAGVATVGNGFVLLRPATVAGRPAVDAYYSPNGAAWTFTATLNTPGGFAANLANGGPDGAVVTGVEGGQGGVGGSGRTLTAFASANGRSWQQTRPLGTFASQALSGVALAPDGAVVTAPSGASATPESACDAKVPRGRVCCQDRPFAEANAVSVRPDPPTPPCPPSTPVTTAPSGPPFARLAANPPGVLRVAVNVQPTPFGEK